jgi:hypothetical protein
MNPSLLRKNKIDLSDYNYARDIENRLIMAQFSVFETDILREILHSSLKFTVKQLADALSYDEEAIIPVLDKLSKTKLLHRMNNKVTVDKEMRKYYETQILKFDEDFEPGMEFLQSLLSKVPIHALPSWYVITRSSDKIFNSIIEKYLLTPKIYEKYLQELSFDDPVLHAISGDVFAAPDFTISAQTLREKHSLSQEEFEKNMLLLEYHLVCCLNYTRVNDHWEEIVTPFHEWHEFLRFQKQRTPTPISDSHNIQRLHPLDFGFVKDIGYILKHIQKKALDLKQTPASHTHVFLSKDISHLLPHLDPSSPSTQKYLESLVLKLLQLQVAEVANNQLCPLPTAQKWLGLHVQDQALSLYRLPVLTTFTDRDIREIERSLKRVVSWGWIYLDEFLKGLTISFGNAEPVTLKNKGKRWKYTHPSYSDEEYALVKTIICDKLFEAGMTAIGFHHSRLCFCVTPFGRMSLGE